MKILNLHGLNGSNTNTNFKLLNSIYASDSNVVIESPQIDYVNISPKKIISDIQQRNITFDIVVGNSFGGFFAYIIGARCGAKTILTNPCIPPHVYIPNLVQDYKYTAELKYLWDRYENTNFNYSMILGDSDEVINIQTTLNVLNPANNRYSIINGGHSLSGEEYEYYFKEMLR